MHILNIFILASVFYLPIISSSNLTKEKLSSIILWKFEKRPFCNAFTGCGRKRTFNKSSPLKMKSRFAEMLSDFLDLRSDPAVENVQQQIMSQAKIFEAIKEAKKQIVFQKNKNIVNEY